MPHLERVNELMETIVFNPDLKDTGDLEAATKTITAPSKPAAADYTSSTLSQTPSPDSRLKIARICHKVGVVIDSGTAGTLNLEVKEVNSGVVVMTKSWAVPGSRTGTQDHTSGALFTRYVAGLPCQYEFRFWVDTGNAVLSLVELWSVVGTCSLTRTDCDIIDITHEGFITVVTDAERHGSGLISYCFNLPGQEGNYLHGIHDQTAIDAQCNSYLVKNCEVTLWTNDANTPAWIDTVVVVLRSG